MAYKGDPEKDLCVDFRNQKTLSFAALMNTLENFESNCIRNNIDTTKVPVVINKDRLLYGVPWFGVSLGIGRGAQITIEPYHENAMPILEDKRPAAKNAEYWASRGASDYDVSGFVKSKKAGERLLRMVKYILEKDEIETWLDYRVTEPEWIQFKFSANEFDVKKLSQMSCDNDDIITEEIIRACVKENK